MAEFIPVYIYFTLVLAITLAISCVSGLFPTKRDTPVKFMPFESGIQTQTHLLKERFPLKHYLVALIFLVFDIEIIFLYPWAVISKEIGPFAFYEMTFFLVLLLGGFAYVWRKGGFEWE